MTLIGTKIKLQSVAPFLRKRSVSWLRVCVSKGSVVGFRPTMPERDPEIVYSPSKWSKRFPGDVIVQKFLEITGNASKNVRSTIPNLLDVSYGPLERQKIDIYGTDLPDGAPIYIHIHGGYWQEEPIGRENSCFVMKSLYKHGIKGIIIGYDLCPSVTLQEVIEEIKQAFLKCLEYAKNSKSRAIVIGGHSAGGHLIASLFVDFFQQLPNEEQNLIKAAFLIAGIYDLLPLLATSYNIPLKLDEKSATRLSPMHQPIKAKKDIKFYVISAANESPAFIQQAKIFHKKLDSSGLCSKCIIVPDTDHFDVIEKLMDEEYTITKLIIKAAQNMT